MLTYKAMYRFLNEGVHAEVLDFPGVITCAANLDEARRLLASALKKSRQQTDLSIKVVSPLELANEVS